MDDDTKKDLDKLLSHVSRQHPGACLTGEFARAVQARLASGSSGPARVATAQYRSNWDGIFGAKPTVGVA
jgi:hypothetical protein